MDEGPQSGEREPIISKPDGSLEAPAMAYTSPSAARITYKRLQRDAQYRAITNAMVDGLIAGEPPYDEDELAQNGLDHISNFNDPSANSTYERSMLAYSNATFQTRSIAKFVLNIDDQNAQKYARRMAIEYDYVMKKWASYYPNTHKNIAQLTKYGS